MTDQYSNAAQSQAQAQARAEEISLGDAETWDDSALISGWDAAVEEYKVSPTFASMILNIVERMYYARETRQPCFIENRRCRVESGVNEGACP